MENKLQELTRKLYDEGLSKGREEAESLVAEAKKESERILREANQQAARIVRDAETSAEDLRKNTLTELNLAGNQLVGKLKSTVSEMVVTRAISDPLAKATLDPGFVKQLLLTIASNWKGSSEVQPDLEALLPAQLKKDLETALDKSVTAELGAGLDIRFSDGVKSGLRIGPKEGGYYISFNDADFRALLDEYLRPRVSEVLFGENR